MQAQAAAIAASSLALAGRKLGRLSGARGSAGKEQQQLRQELCQS
jgi:hypothetical protein